MRMVLALAVCIIALGSAADAQPLPSGAARAGEGYRELVCTRITAHWA